MTKKSSIRVSDAYCVVHPWILICFHATRLIICFSFKIENLLGAVVVKECDYPEILADLTANAKCGTHYRILCAKVYSFCLYKKYEVTFVVKEACGKEYIYCICYFKFYCGTIKIVYLKKEDKFADCEGNI